MKHIGWCLDNIQIILAGLPKNIDSMKDREKATQIINGVEGYAKTLEQLVHHPKLRGYLNKLKKSNVAEVILQEHEIEELLKDLEHMLYLLDLYIQELRELIKTHSNRWDLKLKDSLYQFIIKIEKKKKKLRKENNIAKKIKSMLRKEVYRFNNRAEDISFEIGKRFEGDRGDLRKEFLIALHTKEDLKRLVSNEKHLAEFLK